MVEARVELHFVLPAVCLDADAPQHLFPLARRLFPGLVEGQRPRLGQSVLPCVLHGGVGDAHLHRHLLALLRGEGEIGSRALAARLSHLPMDGGVVEGAPALRSLAGRGREIDRYGRPRLVSLDVFGIGDDEALDGAIVEDAHLCVLDCSALSHTVADVKDEVALLRFGECVALQGDALRGCHLCPNAVVQQQDAIVARRRYLVVVAEVGAVALLYARLRGVSGHGDEAPRGGHDADAAHLELMGARKTLDRSVAIVVARGLPAVHVAVVAVGGGSGFGHAEGQRARREVEVATVGRADARLHILSQTVLALRQDRRGESP